MQKTSMYQSLLISSQPQWIFARIHTYYLSEFQLITCMST